MPSANAVRAAKLPPKTPAQTLGGVGSAPPAPSPAELSWGSPPIAASSTETTQIRVPATAKARTLFGAGSMSPAAPAKPTAPPPVRATAQPPAAPVAQAEKASSSAFGTAQKKPVAKTITGLGAGSGGAFASPQTGLRAPGQGSTDETRQKSVAPEGAPIGRVVPPAKVAKKATMTGLGNLGDDLQVSASPPPRPTAGKAIVPPPVDPMQDLQDSLDEEDASERTVVGDSLAHVRAALAQQDAGRTTPVHRSEDVATADTLRPAPGKMLGMVSPGRTTDQTVPVGVPVPDERTNRPSVPAPGGTWSDRPGAKRPSQPSPAAATGAFGDAARTSAPPGATPDNNPFYVPPPAPRAPSVHEVTTLRTPPTAASMPSPPPPSEGAQKPATTSDEANTVGTGEHTLIIPRDKALTTPTPRGRKTAIIVMTGLLFVTFAAVLGVLVSRYMIVAGRERLAASHAAPPAQQGTTVPTTTTMAQTAAPTTMAQTPTPTPPTAMTETQAPPTVAVAVPTPPPTTPVPPTPVAAPPTPTPTTTPTDLTGITPDARLPRDDADASDVLVEDALRLITAGRLDVARVALDRAVARDRINPQAYEAYARYDIAARNFPHAIEMAQRAVELRRNKARYYLVLGDAHLAAGDRAQARDAWTRGAAIDRDRECRARLEANP